MGYRPYLRPKRGHPDPEPTAAADPHPREPYKAPARWDRYFPPRADTALNAIVIPITEEAYRSLRRSFGSIEALIRDRYERPDQPLTILVEVLDNRGGRIQRREEYKSEEIWT